MSTGRHVVRAPYSLTRYSKRYFDLLLLLAAAIGVGASAPIATAQAEDDSVELVPLMDWDQQSPSEVDYEMPLPNDEAGTVEDLEQLDLEDGLMTDDPSGNLPEQRVQPARGALASSTRTGVRAIQAAYDNNSSSSTLSTDAASSVTDDNASGLRTPPGESSSDLGEQVDSVAGNRFGLGYYNIFYGPSLNDPGIKQPNPSGGVNEDAPVYFKNFLTLSYAVDRNLTLSGVGYWHYMPVRGQGFEFRDPYAALAHNSLMSTEYFNWYGDLRFHFPVTTISREQDMLTGVETFHNFRVDVPNTRLTVGTTASARLNIFGSLGYGNDAEFYLGPQLFYTLNPKVALTLLYEMGMSHSYGAKPFELSNDGTDLQPGLTWDVTPSLNFSPYLVIFTGNRVSLNNTGVGFTLNWQML